MISLNALFSELAKVFDTANKFEALAKLALEKTTNMSLETNEHYLNKNIVDAMTQNDSHPVCEAILRTPLNWLPPTTSYDPLYVQHSVAKAHVELIGPTGLVKSKTIRIGLYGMPANTEYGIRTHPADEIYVMLAGKAYWKVNKKPYILHQTGDRSYHPSMVKHANRTGEEAFMSIYVWHGDISTENYVYNGIS